MTKCVDEIIEDFKIGIIVSYILICLNIGRTFGECTNKCFETQHKT